MQLSFRPITPEDLPFLRDLYASTRAEELRPVPWSEAQKAEFLTSQFELQHAHYQKNYPAATFDLVLGDGAPIGRLYLGPGKDEVRVIDIALVPAHRGAGLGTRLLRPVIEGAHSAGKSVRIYVEQFNPALRFYARLGFVQESEFGAYFLLRCSPPKAGGVHLS